MLSRREFIQESLKINLFFMRIMKEHLIFIVAALPPINEDLIHRAEILKRSMEMLLDETVDIANGAISQGALDANIIVTPYTLDAEEVISGLTGIPINTRITEKEYDLTHDRNFDYTQRLENQLENINSRARNLTEEIIDFKIMLLNLILECKVFANVYPSLIHHITEEAEMYVDLLDALEKREFPEEPFCDILDFWNHTMADHAEFINGLLDPSEEELKEIAARLTRIFEDLVADCRRSSRRNILDRSRRATREIVEYKRAATIGLLECEIRSMIPPLLADHVLREANYYLMILNNIRI